MAIFSMRGRRKFAHYGLTAFIALIAMVLQVGILNNFPVNGVYCNLPLTLVIVWGAVFGSPLPPITPDELRLSTTGEVFTRQLASGSIVGFVVGAFFAALYAPMVLTFPFYLPLAGWIAGYFCLRHINQQNFLCIPLVFVLTLLAETLMAWQLFAMGRSGVLDQLMQIAVPEACLNALIAPFIYFPMRRWYDLTQTARIPSGEV
jgi:rod shape-determining protein MreD